MATRSPDSHPDPGAPRYWLVVPAAGSGVRFGAAVPKQYLRLGGQSVLERALAPFLADPQCRGGAVALAAGDAQRTALAARLPASVRLIDGGAQRSDSVLAGLRALPAEADDWVLVHDAARPLLSARDLQALLAAAAELDVLAASGAVAPAGAILAEPLTDTLKRADAAGCIQTTLERAALWRAQTPQMFRHGALGAALLAAQAAGRTPTDEAQALEWQGAGARLVAARDPNFKITTPADLRLAAALLAVPVPAAADAAGESAA